MTFLTIANSIQDSAPVELYTFTRGADIFRFTSGAAEVEISPNIYEPWPISRGRIKQTEDMNKNSLEIKFPKSNTFAMYYIKYPSVQMTHVQIQRGFPATGEYQNWWKGRLIGTSLSKSEIILECESIFTALKRPGLRKMYEVTCCHTLYDADCRVTLTNYVEYKTITNIDGRMITLSDMTGVADRYYNGGMLVSSDLKRYYLSIQNGDTFQIFLNPELEVGDKVAIYPGCDHLYTTCKTKFNNGLNYGGFPWMPNVNPYSGITIS